MCFSTSAHQKSRFHYRLRLCFTKMGSDLSSVCSSRQAYDVAVVSGSRSRFATPTDVPVSANPLHDGSILCHCELDDNTRIITCSDDKRLSVIDKRSLTADVNYRPKYLVGHSKAVNRLVQIGNTIWSASRDLSLKQWSIGGSDDDKDEDGGESVCVRTIADAHTLNISSIAAQKGAGTNRVYSGSRDYSVKGWDTETGACVVQYSAPLNIVTALCCSAAQPNLLYQGSEDLCVRVWDTRASSSNSASQLKGYVYFPLCMEIHSNGYSMATGCKGFDSTGNVASDEVG